MSLFHYMFTNDGMANSMAAPHVAGVAALFLGAGNEYGSVQELYADLIRKSTQASVKGLQSNDRKTSRNLIYNKSEL